MLGAGFMFNVLVDGERQIVGAVAGDLVTAHRKGCDMVAKRSRIVIPELADIVLASAGGYPKDLNLYQAQKALENAASAVCQGGIIILVAECRDGWGNHIFKEWMTRGWLPVELLDRIQQRFVLGAHKAAAIARVARKAHLFLVSSSFADGPLMGMEYYPTVQAALDAAIETAGRDAQITVLPHGGSVLPEVLG
jgi:nickel-dependent lactate racemase